MNKNKRSFKDKGNTENMNFKDQSILWLNKIENLNLLTRESENCLIEIKTGNTKGSSRFRHSLTFAITNIKLKYITIVIQVP